MRLLVLALFLTGVSLGVFGQTLSKYTSLSEKSCHDRVKMHKQNIIYNAMCPGISGYRLNSQASEEHEWIDLITPRGKAFGVGMQSASYNHIGDTAEWRMRNGRPIALIIRYNIMSPELDKVASSKLVVSKISDRSACVVEILEGTSNQNAKARRIADSSASLPCKAEE